MLRGDRVRLRAMERDDLKRRHRYFNQEIDLVTLGYGDWIPRPLAGAEKRFEKSVKDGESQWEFAIEADGKMIGEIGLHHWSADQRSGSSEFGVMIFDPEYVGRGYGREAIELFLEWAFVVQNFRRVGLTALVENERAVRLYRAIGFVEEGRQREQDWHNGMYRDVVVMGLLRAEWEAQRAAGTRGNS